MVRVRAARYRPVFDRAPESSLRVRGTRLATQGKRQVFMNRRTLQTAPLALVCGLALASSLTGCSVSWRSEYSRGSGSRGSSSQSSGAERPQPAVRQPRRAPAGRENVERATRNPHVGQPSQPAARPDKPNKADRGASSSHASDLPAVAAGAGESGSPVPTPESTSPVAPPVTATPDTSAGASPSVTEPPGKTIDKQEGEPHYAPKSERKPVKRSRDVAEPKQNRNRVSGEATPSAPKTDRTR